MKPTAVPPSRTCKRIPHFGSENVIRRAPVVHQYIRYISTAVHQLVDVLVQSMSNHVPAAGTSSTADFSDVPATKVPIHQEIWYSSTAETGTAIF